MKPESGSILRTRIWIPGPRFQRVPE